MHSAESEIIFLSTYKIVCYPGAMSASSQCMMVSACGPVAVQPELIEK